MNEFYRQPFECEACGREFFAQEYMDALGVESWHKNFENHSHGGDLLCTQCGQQTAIAE